MPNSHSYRITWYPQKGWIFNKEKDCYLVGETLSFKLIGSLGPLALQLEFVFKDADRQAAQLQAEQRSLLVRIQQSDFNRIDLEGVSANSFNANVVTEILHTLLNDPDVKIISAAKTSTEENVLGIWEALMNSGEYSWARVGPFFCLGRSLQHVQNFVISKKALFWEDVEFSSGPESIKII